MLFFLLFCSQYCTSSKLIVVLRCFVSVWRQTANGGTNWKYWFHCFGVALEVYWLDKISWRNNRWGMISYSLFLSLLLLLLSGIEKSWVPELFDLKSLLIGVQTTSQWQGRVWRCVLYFSWWDFSWSLFIWKSCCHRWFSHDDFEVY